ncbi:MAG: chlorophyllase, partial [Coleofasciculus sp.]
YQTTITTNGDPADIYFPIPSNSNTNTNQFPIALMLQGALVDKADYANFASTVASYGFPVRPLLDQDVATETIARWSALFLRSHLLNDTAAFDYLYNSGDDQDENVIVIHPINPLSESAFPLIE